MAALALVSASSVASAQDKPKPTKEQQTAAAAKFKEGERAFAKHDYAGAAVAFEAAYAIAPHPDVLLNAIDSREKAGDLAIAATWCAHLMREYPSQKASNEASQRLARLRPKLGRLDLSVQGGKAEGLMIDGRPAELGESYVDPGDHIITATLVGPEATAEGSQAIDKRVNVVAGARVNVLLEKAPEVPKPDPVEPKKPAPRDDKPLHPAVFFTGLGLTLVSGAVLIWSGVDTNAALSEFEKNPTQAGFDDGLSKETRTNVLIGVTSALAVASAAIGIFATEWGGGGSSESAKLRVHVGPLGAIVEGAF